MTPPAGSPGPPEHETLEPTRLLRAIVETSEDAIVAKDTRGVVLAWNAAATRIFGFTADEAIGCHISFIIPEDRLHEEDGIMKRLLAGQRVERFETVRVARDGRLVDVELTITPILNERDVVIGASKIARDITERRRAEAALRQLSAELGELNTRKDAFLATLAHELRNPLGAMRTSVAVMKGARPGTEVTSRALSVVERQCAHVARLLDDLLDVSRISRDRLELQLEDVDLAQIVLDTVDVMRPALDAAGLTFTVQLPADPLPARVDPARLQQMIGNLLANAAKYTPAGGDARLVLTHDSETIVITVTDTGIGIAPGMQAAIFDLFVQVPDRRRSQQGLGIGLSLVRRLAELHGGGAHASSAGLGHGSTFEIRLPRRAVRAVAVESPPATRDPRARRVLLIDDDRDNADAFATYLRMHGHSATIAHSGEEALAVVEGVRPDVVLLDIGLPGIDGYETCRQLRLRGTSARIAAVTGWGQSDDRRRTTEAGFDQHLVKPVNPDAVLAFVAAAPLLELP